MKVPYLLILGIFISSFAISQKPTFSMQEAINYGVKNHNRVKLDQLETKRAEWEITEFKSIGMPKLNASINYQYYFAVPQQPVQDFISPAVYGVLFAENVLEPRELPAPEVFEFSFFQKNNLSGQIELSSLIFDGSYIYGLKAARLYRELVEQQSSTTEYDIKTNIIKAYMSILIAEENLKIVDDNINILDKSLTEVKAIYEGGFVESLDVDRISLSLENTKSERENLLQLIQIGYNVLKYQMSYPLNEELSLSDDLKNIAELIQVENLEEDITIDYNQRPEYSAILTGQALNELNLKRVKASYLPSARAFANVSESLQRNNLFDSNEAGWLPAASAGIAINIPIYDGRERKSQIEQIKIDMEKTEIQKNDFETAVQLQVMNAKSQLINAKNSLAQNKRILELNESIYSKTLIKFQEGVGSSFEVTEAEASLYQAQSSYINALYELVNAKTDLDIALGKI